METDRINKLILLVNNAKHNRSNQALTCLEHGELDLDYEEDMNMWNEIIKIIENSNK